LGTSTQNSGPLQQFPLYAPNDPEEMDESEITTGVIIQGEDEEDETTEEIPEKDEREEKGEKYDDKQNIPIMYKRPLFDDTTEQEESQKKNEDYEFVELILPNQNIIEVEIFNNRFWIPKERKSMHKGGKMRPKSKFFQGKV